MKSRTCRSSEARPAGPMPPCKATIPSSYCSVCCGPCTATALNAHKDLVCLPGSQPCCPLQRQRAQREATEVHPEELSSPICRSGHRRRAHRSSPPPAECLEIKIAPARRVRIHEALHNPLRCAMYCAGDVLPEAAAGPGEGGGASPDFAADPEPSRAVAPPVRTNHTNQPCCLSAHWMAV